MKHDIWYFSKISDDDNAAKEYKKYLNNRKDLARLFYGVENVRGAATATKGCVWFTDAHDKEEVSIKLKTSNVFPHPTWNPMEHNDLKHTHEVIWVEPIRCESLVIKPNGIQSIRAKTVETEDEDVCLSCGA